MSRKRRAAMTAKLHLFLDQTKWYYIFLLFIFCVVIQIEEFILYNYENIIKLLFFFFLQAFVILIVECVFFLSFKGIFVGQFQPFAYDCSNIL